MRTINTPVQEVYYRRAQERAIEGFQQAESGKKIFVIRPALCHQWPVRCSLCETSGQLAAHDRAHHRHVVVEGNLCTSAHVLAHSRRMSVLAGAGNEDELNARCGRLAATAVAACHESYAAHAQQQDGRWFWSWRCLHTEAQHVEFAIDVVRVGYIKLNRLDAR